MEFPNLGKSCSWHLCKTLDFLPFTCVSCNQIFCKEHFHQYSHNCTSLNQEKNSPVPTKSFICFNQDCNNVSSVEMLCPKCSKHFCLLHRYHNCFDTVLDIEEKKRLWNEPKAQFAKSIKVVEEAVSKYYKLHANQLQFYIFFYCKRKFTD